MADEQPEGRRRRKPVRLPGYDYSQPGEYFVTLCTERRRSLFGDVVNGDIVLSPIGEMIRNDGGNLPNVFKGFVLDASVIMPDHVLGVIVLGADPMSVSCRPLAT